MSGLFNPFAEEDKALNEPAAFSFYTDPLAAYTSVQRPVRAPPTGGMAPHGHIPPLRPPGPPHGMHLPHAGYGGPPPPQQWGRGPPGGRGRGFPAPPQAPYPGQAAYPAQGQGSGSFPGRSNKWQRVGGEGAARAPGPVAMGGRGGSWGGHSYEEANPGSGPHASSPGLGCAGNGPQAGHGQSYGPGPGRGSGRGGGEGASSGSFDRGGGCGRGRGRGAYGHGDEEVDGSKYYKQSFSTDPWAQLERQLGIPSAWCASRQQRSMSQSQPQSQVQVPPPAAATPQQGSQQQVAPPAQPQQQVQQQSSGAVAASGTSALPAATGPSRPRLSLPKAVNAAPSTQQGSGQAQGGGMVLDMDRLRAKGMSLAQLMASAGDADAIEGVGAGGGEASQSEHAASAADQPRQGDPAVCSRMQLDVGKHDPMVPPSHGFAAAGMMVANDSREQEACTGVGWAGIALAAEDVGDLGRTADVGALDRPWH